MMVKKASLVLLGVILSLLATLPSPMARDEIPSTIDRLVHDFVEAFNAGEYDTMASFYENSASTSFQERRTEQEARELHQQLLELLGKISVEEVKLLGPAEVRLVAERVESGQAAEFRFRLVGDPPQLDGFSVGMPDEGEGHGSGAEHGEETKPVPPPEGPFAFLGSTEGVHQSQVLLQADGSLLLVWVQEGAKSFDVFAAHQVGDGEFSHPTRLNLRGVNRYTGDEARPSVAVGPEGQVAVAWTAANNDIMLAVGEKFGRAFGEPLKLNQDASGAYRTMPAVALSPDGAANVVWLDPREAPKGKEEPSDLYYARVKDGVVVESNLTAQQESTVCGCCRPFISIDGSGRFDIAFRNSSAGGYRDISRIVGDEKSLGEPRPTSPPIWKLGGCPMAGPVVSRGGTLWKDASTGSWRLLWSTDAGAEPEWLLADRKDLVLTHSPRRVSGRDSWILLGGKPHGLILGRDKDSWKVLRDDLPPWATSAAVENGRDGRLILVGNEGGRLRASIVRL